VSAGVCSHWVSECPSDTEGVRVKRESVRWWVFRVPCTTTSLRLNDVIVLFQANFELGLVIRVAIRKAERVIFTTIRFIKAVVKVALVRQNDNNYSI
jgi:hypothetical protein